MYQAEIICLKALGKTSRLRVLHCNGKGSKRKREMGKVGRETKKSERAALQTSRIEGKKRGRVKLKNPWRIGKGKRTSGSLVGCRKSAVPHCAVRRRRGNSPGGTTVASNRKKVDSRREGLNLWVRG